MALHTGRQTLWTKVFVLYRVLAEVKRVLHVLRDRRSLQMHFSFKANIVARFVRPMLGFRVFAAIDNPVRLAKR